MSESDMGGHSREPNARRQPRPRKRVLELSGGVGSRPQVLRWNAVRRARCDQREPRPKQMVCADCVNLSAVRTIGRHAPGGVLLPFICCTCAEHDRAKTGPTAGFLGVTR